MDLGYLLDISQGGFTPKGTCTYPIAFTQKLTAVGIPYNGGNGDGATRFHNVTNTGFYCNGDAETYGYGWLAVGV